MIGLDRSVAMLSAWDVSGSNQLCHRSNLLRVDLGDSLGVLDCNEELYRVLATPVPPLILPLIYQSRRLQPVAVPFCAMSLLPISDAYWLLDQRA